MAKIGHPCLTKKLDLRKMRITLVIWICSWLLGFNLNAQEVSFIAETTARQVILGNTFEVDFTLINEQGQNFTPPAFKDFDVVSGPFQSTQVSAINGVFSRKQTFTFTVRPKKVGTFSIGSGQITVGRKVLKTKPVRIEVLKGKSGAQTQAQLDQALGKEIFIKAIPSVMEGYIGQQILVDYKLYSTKYIDSYNIVQEPEYEGFYMEQIRNRDNRALQEVIDGVQYSTRTLLRIALYPQQTGLKTIEPMAMTLNVVSNNSRRRSNFFFNRPTERLNVKTEALEINIRDLPANAPASFSGAVGDFDMLATIDRPNPRVNESVTLRMKVTGNGDLKQVLPPTLPPPDGLQAYDPEIVEEEVFERAGYLNGKKTFDYTFIPKKTGRYALEPAFTYFDPDSSAYITLKPRIFTFTVTPAKEGTAPLNPTDQVEEQKDIRDIVVETRLHKRDAFFIGSPLFWICLLAPIIVFLGWIVQTQRQKWKGQTDPTLLRKQRAHSTAEKHLSAAAQFLKQEDPKAFYKEISEALLGYVSHKLSLSNAQLSKAFIQSQLAQLNLPEASIQSYNQLLETSEMALFGGQFQPEKMEQVYQEAKTVFTNIEEELSSRKEQMKV